MRIVQISCEFAHRRVTGSSRRPPLLLLLVLLVLPFDAAPCLAAAPPLRFPAEEDDVDFGDDVDVAATSTMSPPGRPSPPKTKSEGPISVTECPHRAPPPASATARPRSAAAPTAAGSGRRRQG